MQLNELKPIYPLQLNTKDATPEAIAELLSQQGKKMGILSGESGIIEIITGLYNKGVANIDLLLDAYDGNSYIVNRRSKERISLEAPLLTIGLMIQPSFFSEFIKNPVLNGRGFTHRFLYSFYNFDSGHEEYHSGKVSDEIYEKYTLLINRLLDIPVKAEIPVIKYDKEADKIFEKYFYHIQVSIRKGGAMFGMFICDIITNSSVECLNFEKVLQNLPICAII